LPFIQFAVADDTKYAVSAGLYFNINFGIIGRGYAAAVGGWMAVWIFSALAMPGSK
jgi:hypothetical protein